MDQIHFHAAASSHGLWECPLVIKATVDAFLVLQTYTRHATNNFRIYHYIQCSMQDVVFTQPSVWPIYLAQLSSASGRQTIPLITKPKTIPHRSNVTQPGWHQLRGSLWTSIPSWHCRSFHELSYVPGQPYPPPFYRLHRSSCMARKPSPERFGYRDALTASLQPPMAGYIGRARAPSVSQSSCLRFWSIQTWVSACCKYYTCMTWQDLLSVCFSSHTSTSWVHAI